jgi:hypothetical protein
MMRPRNRPTIQIVSIGCKISSQPHIIGSTTAPVIDRFILRSNSSRSFPSLSTVRNPMNRLCGQEASVAHSCMAAGMEHVRPGSICADIAAIRADNRPIDKVIHYQNFSDSRHSNIVSSYKVDMTFHGHRPKHYCSKTCCTLK